MTFEQTLDYDSKNGMTRLAFLFFFISMLTIWSYGQQMDSVKNEEFICTFEPSASFPGGYDSLYRFIGQNLKYPTRSEEYVGIVFIEFTVNENGSLTDFRVVKGLCDPCDESAIETMKRMPNWIPAKMRNKLVKTKMVIPIKYDFVNGVCP